MRFAVGDIAIVRNTVAPSWAMYVGTECIVIEINPDYLRQMDYEVRLCDGRLIGAGGKHLRKRGEDNNNREKGTWEELEDIWKPKILEREQLNKPEIEHESICITHYTNT